MSRKGRIPNRSNDLSRARDAHRTRSNNPTLRKGTLRPVTIPEPDPGWHPIARQLWDSLLTSGQADFFQNSDWAFAYSLCEDLSLYKKPLVAKDGTEYYKRSGQMLQTIYKAMNSLMVTESDRRQVQLELEQPDDGEQDRTTLAVIDGYKEALKKGNKKK